MHNVYNWTYDELLPKSLKQLQTKLQKLESCNKQKETESEKAKQPKLIKSMEQELSEKQVTTYAK